MLKTASLTCHHHHLWNLACPCHSLPKWLASPDKNNSKEPFLYPYALTSLDVALITQEGNISFMMNLTTLSPFLLLFPFKISISLQPGNKIIAHTAHPFHRIHKIFFSIQTPLISSVLCKVPKPPTSLQTIISSVTALNILGSYSSSWSGKLHPFPPDSTLLYSFISKSLYIWYLFSARLLLSCNS